MHGTHKADTWVGYPDLGQVAHAAHARCLGYPDLGRVRPGQATPVKT